MSSTKPLVLLTGATGFVGAHIFAQLLSEGYRVLATIRSPSKSAYLKSKYPSNADDMSFITIPDIQQPHALDSALEGVEYVCHVASPYFTSTNDPIAELVNPAVEGTRNIIASAIKEGQRPDSKLKKVTVLSSFASVVDLSKNPRKGYVYTAEDWDPVTPEQAALDGIWGYHASKTFAERTAWEMYRAAKSAAVDPIKWDLITFCPPMIYGPPLHEVHVEKGLDGLNTSLKRVLQGITGTDPVFGPKVATPGLPHWVDVRDVALAHVRGLSLPAGTSERLLLCSSAKYYEDGLVGLRSEGSKGLGEVGLKCDPANHFIIDTSKAKTVLGIEFRQFEGTVKDVWSWAKSVGLVGK